MHIYVIELHQQFRYWQYSTNVIQLIEAEWYIYASLVQIMACRLVGANAAILLIGPLWTNLSEILIGIHIFSLKKMHLKYHWQNGIYFISKIFSLHTMLFLVCNWVHSKIIIWGYANIWPECQKAIPSSGSHPCHLHWRCSSIYQNTVLPVANSCVRLFILYKLNWNELMPWL